MKTRLLLDGGSGNEPPKNEDGTQSIDRIGDSETKTQAEKHLEDAERVAAEAKAKEEEEAAAKEKERLEKLGDFNLDKFLEMDFSDDEIFTQEEKYTGIDYHKAIAEAPEDMKKLFANLRGMVTQKTQELAGQRRQLQAQQEALLGSDFFKNLQEEAGKEDAELDPFDEKSIQKVIDQQVQRKLLEALKPMQAEQITQTRKLQLDDFKAKNPDWEGYKEEMHTLLKENEHIKFEQAYEIVKGRALTTKRQEENAELEEYRKAVKEAGLKIGGKQRGSGQFKLPSRREGQTEYDRNLQALELAEQELANKN